VVHQESGAAGGLATFRAPKTDSAAKSYSIPETLPLSTFLKVAFSATTAAMLAALTGCGGNGSDAAPTTLSCDDSLKSAFKPDAMTQVLLVKSYKKGDQLPNAPVDRVQAVGADLCLVKLLVGPGNPGPAGAPSTSPGIGIEVWLPDRATWNGRLHSVGNGGWGGTAESDITKISFLAVGGDFRSAPTIAAQEGAVTVSSDTGHYSAGGAFAMNPDGTINTALWTDYSSRANHEQVVKAKTLAAAYYGSPPRYTYWDGLSTGGRQALKQAQLYPEDYDGIIAVNPALNFTKFIPASLYPQTVMQRDLSGNPFSTAQLTLVSSAALAACDVVAGQHLGFPLDPSACRYDPTKDSSVLCASSGGANATAACVTPVQAQAINKIWYGMTSDGSVPDPALDNGWSITLSGSQRWYGLTRGTILTTLAGTTAFSTATDLVALSLQDPTIAGPSFINATGNGSDGWKKLSYAQLADAVDRGRALQHNFAFVDTDSPDLSKFKARGGKLLMLHGLSDDRIFPQGSMNYYERVLAAMGGLVPVQEFFRFYLLPGMNHVPGNGTVNTSANPPIPGTSQVYDLLTAWVEKDIAPENVVITSPTSTPVQKSLPMCAYPKKPTYRSGDIFKAASYSCV